MAQVPGNGDEPTGPTGITVELTIIINGRSVSWAKPTISFAEVVEQWDKLDPERTVLPDLPGIDVTWPTGTTDTMYPPDPPLSVVENLEFDIDENYLS